MGKDLLQACTLGLCSPWLHQGRNYSMLPTIAQGLFHSSHACNIIKINENFKLDILKATFVKAVDEMITNSKDDYFVITCSY